MGKATEYQSYYTKSEPILDYMASMLDFKQQDSIFEPCGGDGVFVDKILSKVPSAKISIFELNPKAIDTLRQKYSSYKNITIKQTDTLVDESILSQKIFFDKIIGNPPYGAKNSNAKKDILSQLYPKLYIKESYTLFLYACIQCLSEGGMLSFIIPDTFLSLHRHIEIRKYLLRYTKIKELSLFPSSFFPGINFGYANLCIITLQRSSDIACNLSNTIRIRNGFSKVSELCNPTKGDIRTFLQSEVYSNISSAFFFNSSNRINQLVNNLMCCRIGDIADCVTGFYSGNDKVYLRSKNTEIKNAKKYIAVSEQEICERKLTDDEKQKGIVGKAHFVPIVKGGNKQYVKSNEWFMDWSETAIQEYLSSKKCRFQNSSFYFKKNGIGIPMIRSSKLTAALIDERLFDQSIVGVFPYRKELTMYLLAFFNSNVCTKLIEAINPSTNNSANYIKKIPFIPPTKEQLDNVNEWMLYILRHIDNKKDDISLYERKLEDVFEEVYGLKE